mgnify:CR=1 FL=1
MFETLKRLYKAGKLTAAGLEAAVLRGWITQAQRMEIAGREE